MKSQKTILANIDNHNYGIGKKIDKQKYYDRGNFISDVKSYIKAIKEGRMFCVIDSVSQSGMSRNIHFHSAEKYKDRFGFRQYWTLFKVLGYTEGNSNNNFRISGCGMDMIFHTNYSNIHTFKRLGFLTDKECEKLCQMTPATF
jgi:hypothetical protein